MLEHIVPRLKQKPLVSSRPVNWAGQVGFGPDQSGPDKYRF